jgi:methyl-accepting chemotaxis protein
MIETLENRIKELQSVAKQHELALIQISGAIQELTNLTSQMKGAENATEARNIGQDTPAEHPQGN